MGVLSQAKRGPDRRLGWVLDQTGVNVNLSDFGIFGRKFPNLSNLSCYTWLYVIIYTRVADLPGRRRLRSSLSQLLQVPSCRRSTVGRRSFPVAASVLWNSLPLPLATFYYDIFVLTVHAFVDSVIVSLFEPR